MAEIPTEADLVGLMERALGEPVGLRVESESAEALKRLFFIARKKARQAGREDFDELVFIISPKNKYHLLIRNGEDLDA